MSGYENPDYGQVFVHGLDIQKRRNETRKLIGYVPYENDLDPWLTIEQNIRFNATPIIKPINTFFILSPHLHIYD